MTTQPNLNQGSTELDELLVNLIDEHFPKGKSKERGQAMVMLHGFLVWHTQLLEAHKQQALKRVLDRLEKKTIVLDRPLDVDDGEQFCVECGQWTYEGEIDCKCVGYNSALDQVRAIINSEMEVK